MTDKRSGPDTPDGRSKDRPDDRQDRLGAALRENLRRRKAAAKTRKKD